MRNTREWMAGGALLAATLALAVLRTSSAGAQSEEPVPAYHSEVPKGDLPQTMDPGQFANPVVKNAYAVAARTKRILYQQPCYCHCDRGHGHGSLLDCFTSTHGSMCNICVGEALYSYEQSRKGRTAAQIRDGIMKGEWQKVDAAKYQTYPARP
jgi:Protein of unknown function with PCYCGC motif